MAERSTSRTRSRSPLISARSLSASKYGRAYANQAESICNDFLEECRELEYQSERHFKPKEAEKSGKRMHNQFYVQQQRLKLKKQEIDKERLKEVKEKPNICK